MGTYAFTLVCRKLVNLIAVSNSLHLIAKELECLPEVAAALLSELPTEEL